ncbi:MAG: ribokinase [Acidimicrobiia bacterium]
MGFDVVVIGSVNNDVTVMTPRLPRPGETVIGTRHFIGPGGKGANQAVAVARLGGKVALVAVVGADELGEAMLAGLVAEGVDTSAVDIDPSASTGIAVITVDADAENTIVVSPGANRLLTPDVIGRHAAEISSAQVVIAQLEVPVDAVLAAAQVSTGIFCLNPAPAQALPSELLERVDVLVPNRSELSVLAGRDDIVRNADVPAAARAIRPNGTTVVTLGSDGTMLVSQESVERYEAFPVEAVDPTGAGDAFCGALAYSLSRGNDIEHAVAFSSAAGALAVTRPGAQAGMPSLAEVEALLSR